MIGPRLWHLYVGLAVAFAATLGALTYAASSGRQFSNVCRSTPLAVEREACAALGR